MDKLYEYFNSINHFKLAEGLNVDHGDAVMRARDFCPSGWGNGRHGSTCPCNVCTTHAVLMIFEERWRR
jgi:hypothetical protein